MSSTCSLFTCRFNLSLSISSANLFTSELILSFSFPARLSRNWTSLLSFSVFLGTAEPCEIPSHISSFHTHTCAWFMVFAIGVTHPFIFVPHTCHRAELTYLCFQSSWVHLSVRFPVIHISRFHTHICLFSSVCCRCLKTNWPPYDWMSERVRLLTFFSFFVGNP